MNKYFFVGLSFMLLACNFLFGQTREVLEQPMLLLQEEKKPTTPLSSLIVVSPAVLPQLAAIAAPPAYLSSLTLRNSLPVLRQQPLCYSSEDLAFFCRLEVKIESATKMSVRFRLGDVQQVDYLEGKFTGWRYGY